VKSSFEDSPAVEPMAQCPSHPGSPAAFVCDRCGSFGCEACRVRVDGAPRCARCAARRPGAREVSFGLAARDGLRLMWRACPRLLLVVAAEMAFNLPLGLAASRIAREPAHLGGARLPVKLGHYAFTVAVYTGHSALNAFIEALTIGIVIRGIADVSAGRTRSGVDHIAAASRRYGPMLAITLLQNVTGTVGYLVLCFPGFVSGALLSGASAACVAGERRLGPSLRQSLEMGVAKFWPLVLLLIALLISGLVAEGGARLLAKHLHWGTGLDHDVRSVVGTVLAVLSGPPFTAILTMFYLRAYGEGAEESGQPQTE